MNKKERQAVILEIIEKEKITTQEELSEKLKLKGLVTTQATLSRDIKEMRLTKQKNQEGFSVYQVDKNSRTFDQNLKHLMKDAAILSIARVQFMLVVKTEVGFADILANSIDLLQSELVLGTIAGIDTLMITCKSEDAAVKFEKILWNK